jgi:hypothetical protein
MAGLVPAVHDFTAAEAKAWMPGTCPGKTEKEGLAVGTN